MATRYLMIIMPAFFYISSIGICKFATIIVSISDNISVFSKLKNKIIISYVLTLFIVLNLLISGFATSPYYRMYVNEIGGGEERAGYYFPQDSVYDYQFREAIEYLNSKAPLNSIIATHIPVVAEYYGRSDLIFLLVLELPFEVTMWQTLNISYAIIQHSRIYEQNVVQVDMLEAQYIPEISFFVLNIVVAVIYNLNS
ncbi:MAG: hypothetical protein HeimC2_45620 [Candidatus Heimdallarchaeota archaeon LC_2]|nr:MAG: hypothetical protein HeimC2_45620 [Candidatus Heimdallarchaeota archaeon LC_2]